MRNGTLLALRHDLKFVASSLSTFERILSSGAGECHWPFESEGRFRCHATVVAGGDGIDRRDSGARQERGVAQPTASTPRAIREGERDGRRERGVRRIGCNALEIRRRLHGSSAIGRRCCRRSSRRQRERRARGFGHPPGHGIAPARRSRTRSGVTDAVPITIVWMRNSCGRTPDAYCRRRDRTLAATFCLQRQRAKRWRRTEPTDLRKLTRRSCCATSRISSWRVANAVLQQRAQSRAGQRRFCGHQGDVERHVKSITNLECAWPLTVSGRGRTAAAK